MSRGSRNVEDQAAVPVEIRNAPAGWLEALERSEAQLARGQTVPHEPVLDLMRASITRMEAKQTGVAKK